MTATLAHAVRLNTSYHAGPWSSGQFAALVAGNIVAVALVFVGWLRTSGEGQAGDQIVWLNVSLAGVVVALAVNGLFLARARQTVRSATRIALAGVSRGGETVPSTGSANGSGPTRAPAAPRAGRFVAVAGLRRYHRYDCALVAGKTVGEAQADSFVAAGLVPCEVCEP